MKKIAAVLLIALLAFSMVACTSENSSEGERDVPKDAGTLGNYEVAIRDCEVAKDYEDKDAVVITLDFTNNSDEAVSFDAAMMTTVFQDGVELEFTSVYIDEDSFVAVDDSSMKEIKPGTTLEVKVCRLLSNLSAPVEVEVEELFGNGDKLVKTFDLAQ